MTTRCKSCGAMFYETYWGARAETGELGEDRCERCEERAFKSPRPLPPECAILDGMRETMSREYLCRHYGKHGDIWQLSRSSFGLVLEGPLLRFVVMDREAAKAMGSALTTAAIAWKD